MTKGSPARSRAALSEQEELRWKRNSIENVAEGFSAPVSVKRPRRSLLSRKSVWFLLLAIGTAVVLRQYGRQIGIDSSSASKLIEAVAKFRGKTGDEPSQEKNEDEDAGAHPGTGEAEDSNDPTGSSDKEKERSGSASSSPDDTPEDGTSDENAEDDEEPPPPATLLESAAPLFMRARKKFPKPKTSVEKWTNESAELLELLEEKAGPEAAEALVTLLAKELPSEENIMYSTPVLTKQIVEARKQKMARLANTCFQHRRRREEAYLTYVVMEQHFLSLKKHFETKEELPENLAKVCSAFQGDVDIKMEEERLASARAAYETLLLKEKTSLEALFYHINRFSGDSAVIEAIRKMDELGGEWKSKMSKMADAGCLLNELTPAGSGETPPIGTILSLAAAVTTARNKAFEVPDAAFKCLAKLAEIVKIRKAITSNFAAVHDQFLEGLTPQMMQNAVMEAYEMMEKVEQLQEEVLAMLKSRDGKLPLLEPWLALIF